MSLYCIYAVRLVLFDVIIRKFCVLIYLCAMSDYQKLHFDESGNTKQNWSCNGNEGKTQINSNAITVQYLKFCPSTSFGHNFDFVINWSIKIEHMLIMVIIALQTQEWFVTLNIIFNQKGRSIGEITFDTQNLSKTNLQNSEKRMKYGFIMVNLIVLPVCFLIVPKFLNEHYNPSILCAINNYPLKNW